MQKICTMRISRKNLFQGQLTIGVDLVDRDLSGILNACL
jgi:hypothetical protein